MPKSAQYYSDRARHRRKQAEDKRRGRERKRSCRDKTSHKSRTVAEAQASKWRREMGAPALTAYRCPFCGEWHLTKKEPITQRRST